MRCIEALPPGVSSHEGRKVSTPESTMRIVTTANVSQLIPRFIRCSMLSKFATFTFRLIQITVLVVGVEVKPEKLAAIVISKMVSPSSS